MSWETTQTLISLTSILIAIGILVIIFLIIRGIWRAIKKFIFELIDHANGTAPRPDAGKPKYIYEARNACEKVTPKQKQNQTPPWEE